MIEESAADRELENEYRRIQPIYQSLSETVNNILKHAIPKDVSAIKPAHDFNPLLRF